MKNKIISIITILIIIISIFNLSKATTETNNIVTEDTKNNKVMALTENEAEEKMIKVQILNLNSETKTPIVGSVFSILNEDYTIHKGNLTTNAEGKINIELKAGKYCIKQNSVPSEYTLNIGITDMDLNNTDSLNITVENGKPSLEEIGTKTKEINIKEENKDVIENNEKEVTNIKSTNIKKERVDKINETNWNKVTNFNNNNIKKEILNLSREDTYNNLLEDVNTKDKIIQGYDNISSILSKSEFWDLMEHIMSENTKVPILPVASM